MAFVNTERYIEEKQNWLALKTMYISLCACRDVYVGVRERERGGRERKRERERWIRTTDKTVWNTWTSYVPYLDKILLLLFYVYLKINLQKAWNGQKEAVAPLVHTRILNVKINDYGSYDPSPSMDKPHFKLIPNWSIMYPCMHVAERGRWGISLLTCVLADV